MKLGWMLWDCRLCTAAVGDDKELEKHVYPANSWMETRAKCVLGMSDQVPTWVKIGRSKQVHCSEERRYRKRRKTADLCAQEGRAAPCGVQQGEP